MAAAAGAGAAAADAGAAGGVCCAGVVVAVAGAGAGPAAGRPQVGQQAGWSPGGSQYICVRAGSTLRTGRQYMHMQEDVSTYVNRQAVHAHAEGRKYTCDRQAVHMHAGRR